MDLIKDFNERYSKERFFEQNEYTGLLDSNGFKIYNNDILKVYDDSFCVYFRILVNKNDNIYLTNKDSHITYRGFIEFLKQNQEVKIELLGSYKDIATLKDREFNFSIINEI